MRIPTRVLLLSAAVVFIASTGTVAGDDVQRVRVGGREYLETSRLESRPTSRIEWKQREREVLVPSHGSRFHSVPRTVWVPVTENRWEARWHNWWNPLARPHVAYHHVPRTRWERRTEVVRRPVGITHWVPKRELVDVPVRVLGFREERVIVSRVPVNESAGATRTAAKPALPPATTPRRTAAAPPTVSPPPRRFGGISLYDNDPPRTGAAATILR